MDNHDQGNSILAVGNHPHDPARPMLKRLVKHLPWRGACVLAALVAVYWLSLPILMDLRFASIPFRPIRSEGRHRLRVDMETGTAFAWMLRDANVMRTYQEWTRWRMCYSLFGLTDFNRADWGYPGYRVLWRRNGKDYLVYLRYGYGQIYAVPYLVYVFDQNFTLVRQGLVHMHPGGYPYSLVEARSNTDHLPAELRGRWILAVGAWSDTHDFMSGSPIAYKGRPAPADRTAFPADINWVYVEPIKWDDEAIEFEYGAGTFFHADDLEVRCVEPPGATTPVRRGPK
jgi:hypothetical protein